MSGSVSFSWTLPPGPSLTEEQRALVVEALPSAARVAGWLVSRSATARRYAADLESVAHEGLIWAVRRYEPARGRWLSYAYGGALMRCRMWLRAMKLRETRELDFVICEGEDGDPLTRLDVTPDSAPSVDELLFRRQVLVLVEQLPERERLAVRRYLEDATLEETGAAIGKSREVVRRWEVSGLQLLREEMGLVPRRVRAKPRRPLALDTEARLVALLSDGTPKTPRQLAELTGYTKQNVYAKLRVLGAVQMGGARLWALPRKVA